jgi:DNA-binding helix-hairpin-helix protein with protein kinase domain
MYRDDRGPIKLGRRLGQGGEGSVYEFGGEAVKIYTAPPNGDQAQKLRALLTVRTATLEAVSAWPNRLVYSGPNPVGYVMPKIENHHPIGRICLPASRKREFADKPWGWLIHIARNLAAAVDQIHAAGVIIGDLNDANVFVSRAALVRMIDVDSFQISVAGKSWHTGVGVPMYLPPELQARDLRSIPRTQDHDAFGLAIMIFALLMMGRHPWGGVYRSDKSIEDLIATEPFAYGHTARARGIVPPKAAPRMEWLHTDVAAAFERAFTARVRPSPHDWVVALETFRAALARCTVSATHEYVAAQGPCPWCALEARSGIFYFLPSGTLRRAAESPAFAITALERQLVAIKLPENFYALQPKSVPVGPSARPAWVESSLVSTRLLGPAIVALTVVGTARYGAWLFLLGLLVFFTVYRNLLPGVRAAAHRRIVQRELANLNAAWDELIADWHATGPSAGIELYERTKKDIARYRQLGQVEIDELQALQRDHREIMFTLYLATFMIRDANLGLSKKAVRSLEAYGIQTAADIIQLDSLKVPRIGFARQRLLYDYRSLLATRFSYDAHAALPRWMTDDITLRFEKERRDLETRIPYQIERIRIAIDAWNARKDTTEAAIRMQAQRILEKRAELAMWTQIPAI